MYNNDLGSSFEFCLRQLSSDVSPNRISAKLYEKASKTLFLEKGDSNLRILHETYQEKSPSTHDAPNTNVSTTAIPGRVATNETLSDREVKSVEELRSLRNVETRLRGYLIPQSGGSRARLDVTKTVYDELRNIEGIPYMLNDTIMNMGFRKRELETVPPSPKWRYIADSSSADLQGWQTSFILKYAQVNGRGGEWPWSVRQFTAYSKYDPRSGTCVFALVAAPSDILEELREVFSRSDLSAMTAHTVLNIKMVQTTLASWRSYIMWIAKKLAKMSMKIAFIDPLRERLTSTAYDEIEGRLRGFESIIDDASVALQADKNVVSTLQRMWVSCIVSKESSLEPTYLDDVAIDLNTGFDSHILQLQNLQQKTKTCAQTVLKYRDLASGMLLLDNGKSLENLAVAARADNEATIELAKRTQEDAKAATALTFVAVVFLPTTVVLNFFSTSLYESTSDGFKLKPHWWLFLATGLPMTALILVIWKAYMSWDKKFEAFRFDWNRLSWRRAHHEADKDDAAIKLESLSSPGS